MVSKDAERELARRLRVQRLPINAIAAQAGVAKRSVSTWVRDVQLTPEQSENLLSQQRASAAMITGRGRNARLVR